MLKRHHIATAAAVIGAVAIGAPVAGAATQSPVQTAYAAGAAAAQSGFQAGVAGMQVGANALLSLQGNNQLGFFPGFVNLGPTGPYGPLGAKGPLGSGHLPTGAAAWNLGPSGPLGPGGALGGK
jgi:hypothetical protein